MKREEKIRARSAPGAQTLVSILRGPCEALARAGINIIALCLADTHQFGILRMIVPDWQQAKEVLEGAGIMLPRWRLRFA